MNVEAESDTEIQKSAHAMRVEAASQLKSARELAKKVRAEAVHELEDARARVKKIAAREEEMAARWAKLVEAEQLAAEAAAAAPPPPPPPAPAPPPQVITTDAPGLIANAQAEAALIIEQAGNEAREIREEAMRLLGMAEGEKAESHEIAQSETQRAMSEAERLRAEAEAEAAQLREDAKRVSAQPEEGASIYAKRGGRKLPRIGEGATSVLSQMSDLRAKSAEDEDRKVV